MHPECASQREQPELAAGRSGEQPELASQREQPELAAGSQREQPELAAGSQREQPELAAGTVQFVCTVQFVSRWHSSVRFSLAQFSSFLVEAAPSLRSTSLWLCL